MIRDAEESRSGQFRPITCEIATSDPHVLNPCCQGVGHAFNFDQSQVKSHEGLTCVRVCGFCKLVFSTRSIEYSLVRACFRQGSLLFLQAREFISPYAFLTRSVVSSASLSIHQSVRVFYKLHCTPGLCSVQSAWFSGTFCPVTSALKAGGTTLRISEL